MSNEASGASLLALVGARGIQEGEQLKQELLEAAARGGTVTVDASELTRIDTVGLQLLCALQRDLMRQGRELCFRAVSEPLREAARVAGVLDVLGLNPRASEETQGV